MTGTRLPTTDTSPFAPSRSRRRTSGIRIFPNVVSCLSLVRTLTAEMHENWIEAIRSINMDLLKQQVMRKLDDEA